MILIAAAIALKIDIGAVMQSRKPAIAPPAVTCGIKTVSYRFTGTPGTEFRYDGEVFRVPASGSIELLANQRKTEYEFSGRALPLDVWPQDEFGTRTVPLPKSN